MIASGERMNKFRPIITTLFLALWFISVHHCVFEFLLNDLKNAPISNSSEAKDCASHKSDDSASHKEGQPCSTAKVLAVESVAINFNFVLSDFLLKEFKNKTFENIFLATLLSNDFTPYFKVKDALTSLSAASNAPPYLA